MVIYNQLKVRCPVYLPRVDEKPGCGSNNVKRTGSPTIFKFECLSCGNCFSEAAIDFDRNVVRTAVSGRG